MKKKMKIELANTLKHLSTKNLQNIAEALDKWDHNHRLKKSSWFWEGDNGNASFRRSKEKRFSFYDRVKIGQHVICYYSRCVMSRRAIYWEDALWMDDDSAVNVNFGDIAFLLETIREIIEKRSGKAA